MNWRRDLIVLVGLMIVTGRIFAGQQADEKAAKDKKNLETNTTKTKATQAQMDPGYKIGAEDVLKVDVWKEADITRQVTVRPDGKISLPLLDDVQAAGLTPTELSGAIREGLKKFITEPQVTVTVTEINSRRVYVTGEVNRAGAYPMLPNMTVLQALSQRLP